MKKKRRKGNKRNKRLGRLEVNKRDDEQSFMRQKKIVMYNVQVPNIDGG